MTEWNDIKVGRLYMADDEVWLITGIDDGVSEWGRSIGKELMTLSIVGPRGPEHQTVEWGCNDWLLEVV